MAKKFRPKFAGNGVQNDGAPVDSPKGKGLLNNSPKRIDIVPDQSDKDIEDLGLLNGLGDDLQTSDAMSQTDDDSVERSPQGVKTPGSSKPVDGFTQKLSHNLGKSIAEAIADAMGGINGGVDESAEELTLEEVLEQYCAESDEITFEGFGQYCCDQGYEAPGQDDVNSAMADSPNYLFTPNGDGSYSVQSVPQEITYDDIPTSGGPVVPIQGAAPGAGAVPGAVPGPYNPPQQQSGNMVDDIAASMDGDNDFGGDFGGGIGGPDAGDEEGDDTVEEEGGPLPTHDSNDGCGMEVSTGGSGYGVNEDATTTGNLAGIPSTVPKIASQKVKKAGNPVTAVDGVKNLGKVLDRDLENDTDSGTVDESFEIPAAVVGNVTKIMEHTQKQIAKLPNSRKYQMKYRVGVELNGNSAYTKPTDILAEAAVDAEELAVIGKGNAFLEVFMIGENKTQKGMFVVELPKLKDRKPAVVAEGILFRFPSIAKRVSQKVIGESVTHVVVDHPFGALIKGNAEKLISKL